MPLVDCARRRAFALVKVPIRVLTALNLLPSIATLASLNKLKAPAQHNELAAEPCEWPRRVPAEVGYGLEVRHQAAGQPNQLDVALALPLQAARCTRLSIRRHKSSTARRW